MSESFMVFKILLIFYFLIKAYKANKHYNRALNTIKHKGLEANGTRKPTKTIIR